MQERANDLLPELGSERGNSLGSNSSGTPGSSCFSCSRVTLDAAAAAAAGGGGSRGRGRRRRGPEAGDVVPDEAAVPLLDGAAEELEEDGEADDADAGAGEHGGRRDAPVLGDEAGAHGVVVYEHGDLAAAAHHAVAVVHAAAAVVHGAPCRGRRLGGVGGGGGGWVHGHGVVGVVHFEGGGLWLDVVGGKE